MIKRINIFILLFALIGVFLYFYYENNVKEINHTIYLEKTRAMKQSFQDEIDKKLGKTMSLTYLMSQDKKLIEALKKNDRSLIDFSEKVKQIETFGGYKNLWIQVIDKNGYSFYRNFTDKIGDYVLGIRIDIQDMFYDLEPKKTISTGKFDMTFKTMLPLYDGVDFLGMIEIISKFNSISELLQTNDIDTLIVAHEKYTKKFLKPFSGLFIGKNYVVNIDASKELMKSVEKEGLDSFFTIDQYKFFNDKLVTTYKIKDIHNGEMGYAILFYDKNLLDQRELNEFKNLFLKRIILALVILFLLFLFLYTRSYARNLNKDVAKKTKEIKEQKEELDKLLQIYDENVIFSKTDTKGIITSVSKAFCKISGYTKEELIGKPHNIVRHPDMPKGAFKSMWKDLKKLKSWQGEVKNKKKDGSHYWVYAEIEPEFDKSGELIGYAAVRQNITDAKDIEEIQKEIIFTMGSIGESRSKETGNHVKRVAEYSKLFALKYGLSEEESELLRQASPMHDIGKVGIPDKILKKPARLDEDEKKIMDTHAQIGYEMLNSSDRPLLKLAATIAYEHHEKWDGTGYPRALKAQEISIEGRITAIADVFDALGSERCYKKAWEDEKIFALFKEESGKHFEPKLVEIFFENLDQFKKIRDRFQDKQ